MEFSNLNIVFEFSSYKGKEKCMKSENEFSCQAQLKKEKYFKSAVLPDGVYGGFYLIGQNLFLAFCIPDINRIYCR